MCLTDAKTLKHDNNIICYKVVASVLDKDGNEGKLVSPYFSKKSWKIGKTEAIPTIRRNVVLYGNKCVYDGAYHSFEKLSDAQKLANKKNSIYKKFTNIRYEYKVAECIIPKSSQWTYCGKFNIGFKNDEGDCNCYASQKLKPIRIVG